MSKFTKGTWEFDTELCFVKNKKGDEIAELFWDKDDGDKEERLQANGRLIAAAPEMYGLLREEIVSFERERKIKELLAWIDGEGE